MNQTTPPGAAKHERLPLHWKMAIGFVAGLLGLVAYYVSGADAGWVQWLTSHVTQPAGALFLRLIFMLVIPLLFSALVVGIAEMGDVRSLGRVGWRTLAYTVVVSGIAVVIGLVLVNWLQPGAGVDPVAAAQMLARDPSAPGRSSIRARPSRRACRCCCRSCRTTWWRPRRTTRSWR